MKFRLPTSPSLKFIYLAPVAEVHSQSPHREIPTSRIEYHSVYNENFSTHLRNYVNLFLSFNIQINKYYKLAKAFGNFHMLFRK